MATRATGAIVGAFGEATSEAGINMRRSLVCIASVLGVMTGSAAAHVASCPDGSDRLHRLPPARHLAVARASRPDRGTPAWPRSRGGISRRYGGAMLSSGYGGTGIGLSAPYGFNGPYGPAGGLAVYSPGAFGPGPRIITIPEGYGE